MMLFGGFMAFVGIIIGIIGVLSLFYTAFQTSILWFLGMFIPGVGLIFVILNWEEAKGGFWCVLIGFALRFNGAIFMNMAMNAS